MDWLSLGTSFAASLLTTGIAVGLVLGRLRAVEHDVERAAKRIEQIEGAAARLERATALLERSIEHLMREQDSHREALAAVEARLVARLDAHYEALRRELEAAGALRR